MGRYDYRYVKSCQKESSILKSVPIWVATLTLFSTTSLLSSVVSAAILPGSILPNGDVETEQLPNFPGFPSFWFASQTFPEQFCTANGGTDCTGAFWDTDHAVSGTHSLGLIDDGPVGEFAHSEWRTNAAAIPAGTAFLHWQWDVLYEVLGGFDPQFQVNMRVGGAFVGTGNLINAIDWQLFLEGDSGGQFLTMTGDVPVLEAFGDASFDIIFRTRGGGDTIGEMYIDDVSVVPIQNFSDFDASLSVDGGDFLAWQRGLGLSAPGDTGITAIKSQGDSNGDLTINAADLVIWQQEYGNVQSLSVVRSVPEPTTWLLGLIAVTMALVGTHARDPAGQLQYQRR